MKQVSIIISACIQIPALFDRFRENLRSFQHDRVGRIIVLCNRLSLMSAASLEAFLSTDVKCPVQVIHDKERSVAGAWNRGVEIAREARFDTHLITAVDVSFTQSTMTQLTHFEERHPEADIWSSWASQEIAAPGIESTDGCDFSCFMIRNRTIDTYGWFDKEYKPAYFEDNDYVTRVVIGGGAPKCAVAARHNHQGSLTIKVDPEMAHHVRHWFGINHGRFCAKWKTKTDNYSAIPNVCHKTPFNSNKPITWWPEQDRPGYSPAGGIHE